jgi:hypothetical protein
MYALSGIKTRDSSNGAAADPRRGPHGRWDRPSKRLAEFNHVT